MSKEYLTLPHDTDRGKQENLETLAHLEKVIVAGALGQCAGVNKTLHATEKTLDVFGEAYTNHAVVHHKPIMREFEERGLINIEDLPHTWDDVADDKKPIILSAHGVSPQIREEARKRSKYVFDETCPLVTKVHTSVRRAVENGRTVLYLGKEGHPETEGVRGEVVQSRDEKQRLIEEKSFILIHPPSPMSEQLADEVDYEMLRSLTFDDFREIELPDTLLHKLSDHPEIQRLISLIENYPESAEFEMHNQTTLGIIDVSLTQIFLYQALGDRLHFPKRDDDICYATTNRQRAVFDMIDNHDIDFLLVNGSSTSHNSNMLAYIGDCATNLGKLKGAKITDDPKKISAEWFSDINRVGYTAGASVIDRYSDEMLDWFSERGAPIERLPTIGNEVREASYPVSKELRDYLTEISQ